MKKIVFGLFMVLAAAASAHAGRLWVMDSPTSNILNYGAYDVDIRFFSAGGVQTRLDFGVFKIFNIGIAWEFDKFIGNDKVQVAIPALSAKLDVYSGDMDLPSIALGYDGQGYFFSTDYTDDYFQLGKGVYFVLGREVFFEGLTINGGLNMNNFRNAKVYAFLNAEVPLLKDYIAFMAEYDNFHYFADARLNFGLRFSLSEYIDFDFIMRDCWAPNGFDRVPNERVFKINYSGKF
ncbi:hypothetical protein [Endomicrobium proavitum]|uniref:Outer membrane protein beta-barrel domain-containing protein n=1 Tax=Endomicrobium proavitum TaxID=1408281 RepID=A0A0G3WIT1_9BACT|nr:hypothetical protein [Endomicrobium proavitum]AKL97404.1 conserved exported protein of unknown function [Endomicrobium proavitum]